MVAQSSEVISRNAEAAQSVDRWFYVGVGCFILALCIAGFAPSMIDQSNRAVPLPLTPIVTVHGLSAVAFLVLFIAQSWLAATRRLYLHRRLGILATVVAAVFVVTGWTTVVQAARRGFTLANDILTDAALPLEVQFGPLFNFLTFGLLVTVAIAFRRRPEVHKRLVVLALMGVLSITPMLHITGHYDALRPHASQIVTGAWLAMICVQPIYDRVTRGRIHPVSLWGPVATWLVLVGVGGYMQTTAVWRAFAEWAVANG